MATRKTKIICTIGPASDNPETVRQLVLAGMNVARLNLSHGNHDEHRRRIAVVRRVSTELGKTVAIMLDTKGPEIRTGPLETNVVQLVNEQLFTLTTRPIAGNQNMVSINYAELPFEVKPQDQILLSDGLINLEVLSTNEENIVCRVVSGGELGANKGVNVPGISLKLPFLSDTDRVDLDFGLSLGVDYIAASFVRQAEDLLDIRRVLEQHNSHAGLIAKIESQTGVDNLDEIIDLADGIMVARGDLGVEIPLEEVPLVQKHIIKTCRPQGKIVIIATQMLESMVQNPRPTRAEVSDVANAIFEGADAVMLSSESAMGKHPVEAVRMMNRIALKTETYLKKRPTFVSSSKISNLPTVADALSYATCQSAYDLNLKHIITSTRSGYTAKMVAKYRPPTDILAITPYSHIARQLALVWGVTPLLGPLVQGADAVFAAALEVAGMSGHLQEGETVIMTAGDVRANSTTNLIKVDVYGKLLCNGYGIGEHIVQGRACVVQTEKDLAKLQKNDILICNGYFMEMAVHLDDIKALIAEIPGITSDAAIILRQKQLPGLVGAKNATRVIRDNTVITLDPISGKVFTSPSGLYTKPIL